MRRSMRQRGRVAWCVVALCATMASGAAESTTTELTPAVTVPITQSAEFISAAMHMDAGLRAAQIRRNAADASRHLAQRWDDPRLALEGGRVQTPGDDAWHGRIEISQRLPLGGEGAARIANADSQRALTNAHYMNVKYSVSGQVLLLISDLRAALDQHHASELALTDSNQALAAVSKRLATGEANRSDLVISTLDRDESTQQVQAAERAIATARSQLARRCGIAINRIGDPAPLVLKERTHSEVLAAAMRHPRLASALADIKVAEAQAALSRSDRWTDVRAGVFGERDGDDSEVGVMLEIPLPAWNRNQLQIHNADAERLAARAHYEQIVQHITADAEAGWFAWDAAKQRADNYSQSLISSATEALRLTLSDYAVGKADLTSVITARRTRARIIAEANLAAAASNRFLIQLSIVAPSQEELP